VRKHLSLFKGGQLARAAWPATVLTLALSDVIGEPARRDRLRADGARPSTFADALEVLARRGVAARVPSAIMRRLEAGRAGEIAETPKPVIRSSTASRTSSSAATRSSPTRRSRRRGAWARTDFMTRELQGRGPRRRTGFRRARAGSRRPRASSPAADDRDRPGKGKGGRCQEFALAAALELRPSDRITILAAGTDGTDGPTDATGAIVDAASIERGAAAGRTPGARWATMTRMRSAGERRSGSVRPTRTNLLDLYLAVSSRERGSILFRDLAYVFVAAISAGRSRGWRVSR
jgi:glycerate-2-kinase